MSHLSPQALAAHSAPPWLPLSLSALPCLYRSGSSSTASSSVRSFWHSPRECPPSHPTTTFPANSAAPTDTKAPQLCMGCARWWTEHGDASWNDQPYLFDRLVRDWRRTERPAAIVLSPKCTRKGIFFFSSSSPSSSCRQWRRTSRAREPS